MRLADKVTGLLVIVLAISIALNFAVFRIVIFRGFIQMEDERAVQDMDRCREALKREIDGVRMLAIDWAQWDDSYRFVADGNPEYTEANLLLKSFKDNSLSLIAYYTISNTLVWGQCYDLDTGEEIHLREFAGTTLPDHSALGSYPQTQPAVAGILMTDRGPMLVASATILTSEGLGPPRGHLIMGRFLDAALVKALGERVNLALDIFPIPGGKVPDSVRGIVAQLPAAGAAHIEKKDARRLLVYAIITDINNAPAILLRTTVVREINARARATQHYVSIALLVAGLLILVVIIRLMRVLVVGPISWLTQTVLAVRESARTGLGIHRKIALRRNDEIGVLSREFENTIQEWDAARTRAEQASQAKSDFLTFISHELRTPLNGIMGLAELIANAKSLESNRERARTIIDESESLVNLINELLDTARIEAGKLELESVPFDPAALVEKIVSVMSVRALKKGLGFDVRLDPKLPAELIGDPGRIRQVIVNLAGNSLKFTEQGSVSLGISVLEDLGQRVKLRFEVVDTGIGIPREKQEAIFERFVQADRNIAVRYGGTGLGMSISRDLVRLMGGEIGVDSEVGRGSTFWFQLVLRKGTGTRHGEERGAANQPAPYETGRTGHILLVDDYATNREVAMSHLFAAGYTIETA